jgi:hypothetical protein
MSRMKKRVLPAAARLALAPLALAALAALAAVAAVASVPTAAASGAAAAPAAAPAAGPAASAPSTPAAAGSMAPASAGTSASLPEATGEAKKQAEELFTHYVDYEHSFDNKLVGLYSRQAKIVSRVVLPGKPPRVRSWNGATYRDMLGRALQQARKTKTDLNYYSGVIYLREGSRVRIKAMRYAQQQKALSPMELLVGPDTDGTWRIFEEISETHPAPEGPQPVQ